MKEVYALIEEAKELHGKIVEAWDKEEELDETLVMGWIDHNTKLITAVAEKLEELEERLDDMHASGGRKKK